jgi:hypothetical protein
MMSGKRRFSLPGYREGGLRLIDKDHITVTNRQANAKIFFQDYLMKALRETLAVPRMFSVIIDTCFAIAGLSLQTPSD